MRKTFKYRLLPTKQQKKKLQAFLDACCWVYNKTIETRKKLWEERRESLSLYDTNSMLPKWKEEKASLDNAYSQCLQNAQQRVDLAFKAFFRRVKEGKCPGFPRFKGQNRYDSFTFPQFESKKIRNNRLKISKVGEVKIKLHRKVEGRIKTCTIQRSSTGKWYACFSCEVPSKPLRKIKKVVGIDLGLDSFATLSSGEKVPNPRFFKKYEAKLKKYQRRLIKEEKESKKQLKKLSRLHEKIVNKRRDFAHKLSKTLVSNYQIIIFENLEIKKMIEFNFKKVKKSIGEVAWGQFIQFMVYKAEGAGRTIIFVDPRNTSKKCSNCGQSVKKKLSERVHKCPFCGLIIDRDKNAALNILRLGMQSLVKA